MVGPPGRGAARPPVVGIAPRIASNATARGGKMQRCRSSPREPKAMSTATRTTPDLLLDLADGVARLTLNRPHKRNALSLALLEALAGALDDLAADPSARVVVLAGAGPVFCSGHDLAEMVGRAEADYQALFRLCSDVMLRL